MALNGKRVVIIGGASGIGYAVAQAALAQGASLVIASTNKVKVAAASARLGDNVSGDVIDVSQEADIAAFFDRLEAFDHLVFTAGDWQALAGAALADTDLEKARTAFNVRYWGALAAAKHAQKIIRPGGSITLTSGTLAHRPRPHSMVGTSMAGAVEFLTRGLAVDLAPIRVNAVCPGLIATDVWDQLMGDQKDDRFRSMTGHQPLPRAGMPDEVAQAYLYLMNGGYTTGQILIVDGGLTLV